MSVPAADTQTTTTNPDATRATRRITGSLLRLRRSSPFFATLAMHAQFTIREDLPTAATDGTDVFFNPEFLDSLTDAHLDAVLLHEVLHAALAHVSRRGRRDGRAWNIAADIVVNGLVAGNGFDLPDTALRDLDLEGFSVEEVFAILASRDELPELRPEDEDLIEGPGAAGGQPSDTSDSDGRPDGQRSDALAKRRARERARAWERVVDQAATAARGVEPGSLPEGVVRAFGLGVEETLDWRTALWRFVTASRSDFAAFDRRFAYDGLYLETLENENLTAHVCIDTSGSIDADALAAFNGELMAILAAYPGVDCHLWYADTEAHGPFPVSADAELPAPIGGGGTDFRAFFDAVEDHVEAGTCVLVYLTDGFGEFPAEAPTHPTLWAITAGGLGAEFVPFGEVVRLGAS